MQITSDKAELFIEQLIPVHQYETLKVNNCFFFRIARTGETYLLLMEAGGTKLITFECRCKTAWECNAIMIIVGNGNVKGLVICPHCGTVGMIQFILPSKEILITMFNLDERLINEKWLVEKAVLQ